MKDLDVETRLDVILRSVEIMLQPHEALKLADWIEMNLREYDMHHATKALLDRYLK